MGVSVGSGVSMGSASNADLELLLHGGPAFEARLAQLRDCKALEAEAAARHKEALALKAEAEASLTEAKKQAEQNKAAAADLEQAQQAASDAEAKFRAKYDKLMAVIDG